MTRPYILISNDDGVDAPGLLALRDALATFADTLVVAPESQQSAGSHAITLHKPLRLKERAPGVLACSGTPADCVYVGLQHAVTRKPDLVVSGINDGLNIADDITYSGTVAAAMEGHLMDVRSVAFSQDHRRPVALEAAAKVAAKVCQWVLAHHEALPPEALINVNLPSDVAEDTPWRLTRQGIREYHRQVREHRDPRGRPYYWIGGAHLGYREVPGTDGVAVHAGFVSITPLQLRMTCDPALDVMKRLGLDEA